MEIQAHFFQIIIFISFFLGGCCGLKEITSPTLRQFLPLIHTGWVNTLLPRNSTHFIIIEHRGHRQRQRQRGGRQTEREDGGKRRWNEKDSCLSLSLCTQMRVYGERIFHFGACVHTWAPLMCRPAYDNSPEQKGLVGLKLMANSCDTWRDNKKNLNAERSPQLMLKKCVVSLFPHLFLPLYISLSLSFSSAQCHGNTDGFTVA